MYNAYAATAPSESYPSASINFHNHEMCTLGTRISACTRCIDGMSKEKKAFYMWYAREYPHERGSMLKYMNLSGDFLNENSTEATTTIAGYSPDYMKGVLDEYKNHQESITFPVKYLASKFPMIAPKHREFFDQFSQKNNLADCEALSNFYLRNPECFDNAECPLSKVKEEDMWDTIQFLQELYVHDTVKCTEWTKDSKCHYCAGKLADGDQISFVDDCFKTESNEEVWKMVQYLVNNPHCTISKPLGPGKEDKGEIMEETIWRKYNIYRTMSEGEEDARDEKYNGEKIVRDKVEAFYRKNLLGKEEILNKGLEINKIFPGFVQDYENGCKFGTSNHTSMEDVVACIYKGPKNDSDEYALFKTMTENFVQNLWTYYGHGGIDDKGAVDSDAYKTRGMEDHANKDSDGVYYVMYYVMKIGADAASMKRARSSSPFGRPAKLLRKV